jgi:hypothetical protein
MARPIIWDGATIGIFIEHEGGDDDYIVPPVVFGEDGRLIQGENLLQAIIDSGVPVQVPVVQNCTPALLAELDRRLARASEVLGVPILS